MLATSPRLVLIILSSMFLSAFFFGCSSPAERSTAVESSQAEQIAAVRSGKTDIILLESTPVQDAGLLSLTGIPGLRVLQLDHPDNQVADAGMADLAKLTQ